MTLDVPDKTTYIFIIDIRNGVTEMTTYPIAKDRRYSIAAEYCGYETPRYVLRFCGEFVASSISRGSMTVRAVGHNAMRLGAEPIVNAS